MRVVMACLGMLPAGVFAAGGTHEGDAPAPTLYNQICQQCHGNGMGGAPRLGDKAAWAPRLARAGGVDGLVASAIKGRGSMPARGGMSTASDADVKAAVVYMLDKIR